MEPLKTYIGQIEIALLDKKIKVYELSRHTLGLLFSRLVTSKKVTTYSSMKENIAMFKIDKKKYVTIVDIPGNDRLRAKYLEEFISSARGILFVIDSLNFQKDIRDIAGFLFILLQDPLVHRYKIPFLIACNKQDHAVSKSAKVIQSQLEKEMNTLRVTMTGRLASISPGEETIFLGNKGKDFQFADIRNINFEFINCSALESSADEIGDLLKPWLSKIA
ncbi:signal recognition particle receptor subunit beta [Parasteatoda tepidariorum]|uniref:signal recognition particle receptor subunit beta n=1 Tax=Parasteatoda tepidariorum TaxID=114398 RepID=UPI001C71E021|nr:signal recognition particle receptor subunit beta [Parasteatoda tepidariorum]